MFRKMSFYYMDCPPLRAVWMTVFIFLRVSFNIKWARIKPAGEYRMTQIPYYWSRYEIKILQDDQHDNRGDTLGNTARRSKGETLL